MTLKEFVGLDPKQIRGDEGLMQLFVSFYEAAFSFKPKCVGCSFKSGFKKLKKYAKGNNSTTNINTMKPIKTFQLKKQHRLKILSYKKDGKIYRCYGYNLTDDFANELVKAGKSDLFIKTPDKKTIELKSPHGAIKVEVNDIEVSDSEVVKSYKDMNYKEELIPLYNELKDKTGKKAASYKKADIIEFLENES